MFPKPILTVTKIAIGTKTEAFPRRKYATRCTNTRLLNAQFPIRMRKIGYPSRCQPHSDRPLCSYWLVRPMKPAADNKRYKGIASSNYEFNILPSSAAVSKALHSSLMVLPRFFALLLYFSSLV